MNASFLRTILAEEGLLKTSSSIPPAVLSFITKGFGSVVYEDGAKLVTDNGSYYKRGAGKFAAWNFGSSLEQAAADIEKYGAGYAPIMKIFKSKSDAIAFLR